MIDLSKLTAGEAAFIEDMSGLSIDTLFATGLPKVKTIAALYTIVIRREGNPAYKFNQAMDVPLEDMSAHLGLNEEEPDEDSEEGKDSSSAETETA